MRKRCECGCGRKTNVSLVTSRHHGYVKGRHRRFVKGRYIRIRELPFVVNPTTSCWEWKRYRDAKGYGRLNLGADGGKILAHRLFYTMMRGIIPKEKQLDHLCMNTRCVNPNHLEIVTNAENCRRGINTKLTWKQIHAIRQKYTGAWGEQRTLAKEFGVCQAHISEIVNNKIWRLP